MKKLVVFIFGAAAISIFTLFLLTGFKPLPFFFIWRFVVVGTILGIVGYASETLVK